MKLNYKRTILIGMAFLSIQVFWQFYDNEIPRILSYHFNLGETWTGVVMSLDNILALFLLPMFGTLSDKVDTPFGRRMPFILVGTALSVFLYIMLICVAGKGDSLVTFILLLLLLLITMGVYRAPAVALMPDLTPAPLRSAANAIINLMGTLGAIYTLVMIKLLLHTDAADAAQTNYTPLAVSVAVCMVVTVLILFFTVPEKKISEQLRSEVRDFDGVMAKVEQANYLKSHPEKAKMQPEVRRSLIFMLASVALWYIAYNAVTTAFSRYVTEVWGLTDGSYADCLMVATVAAILAYIPIGIISSRIGRKKTILAGVAMMSVCYLIIALMPTYNALLSLLFALIGIGWAAINVNSYPMVVEMAGFGDIGKYTGMYYTFSMAAQVVTPIASGYLLEHISYRTLFPYAFVFSCLAFVTMLIVRHGDSRPERKKHFLEHFDVED
ncbi:MAG: MFS transporter [Butyrivibrio sp.]|nr:MFS transporter [Butyrivibrio sp.]